MQLVVQALNTAAAGCRIDLLRYEGLGGIQIRGVTAFSKAKSHRDLRLSFSRSRSPGGRPSI